MCMVSWCKWNSANEKYDRFAFTYTTEKEKETETEIEKDEKRFDGIVAS